MEHAHGAFAADPGSLGLIAALSLAGLFGGLGHCATMCGPFVLAQLGGQSKGSVVQRLAGWVLLPFQLGRATTYSVLGAIAGSLGAAIVKTTGARWALAGFLLMGAALFLLHGLKLMTTPSLASGIAARIARAAAPLMTAPRGARSYALGLMLGLLPCGFLYGAVTASAAGGGPFEGALAMAGFAAGTSVSLIAVAVAGRAAATRWRSVSTRLAAPVFLINAAISAILAIKTIVGA